MPCNPLVHSPVDFPVVLHLLRGPSKFFQRRGPGRPESVVTVEGITIEKVNFSDRRLCNKIQNVRTGATQSNDSYLRTGKFRCDGPYASSTACCVQIVEG